MSSQTFSSRYHYVESPLNVVASWMSDWIPLNTGIMGHHAQLGCTQVHSVERNLAELIMSQCNLPFYSNLQFPFESNMIIQWNLPYYSTMPFHLEYKLWNLPFYGTIPFHLESNIWNLPFHSTVPFCFNWMKLHWSELTCAKLSDVKLAMWMRNWLCGCETGYVDVKLAMWMWNWLCGCRPLLWNCAQSDRQNIADTCPSDCFLHINDGALRLYS